MRLRRGSGGGTAPLTLWRLRAFYGRMLGAALLLCVLVPPRAVAEFPLRAERSRLWIEAWGGPTFDGRGRFLADGYLAHAIELEWMLWPHLSFGARGLPVLLYFDGPPVVGTALGITNRLYSSPKGHGVYLGPQVALLLHHGRFRGNTAHLNILSGLEVGYAFATLPLRLGVKLEHVSNANLSRRNRGWNGLALLLAWSASSGSAFAR